MAAGTNGSGDKWQRVHRLAVGYDYLVDGIGSQAGLGSASLLLYLGVTFMVQRLILQARAQRIAGTSQQDTAARTTFS